MKNNLTAQIIYRSIYIVLAVLTLILSIGIFSIGSGGFSFMQNFNPLFITDYLNWAIVMSLCAMIPTLIENIRTSKAGNTHAWAASMPLLRFCTASTMIFCFILGTFMMGRVGNNSLTAAAAENYGLIYPGFLSKNFWTDMSAFMPRFFLPLAYFTGFIIFDERLKTRGIYATLGIVPPTIFYFFNLIFSQIFLSIYGGADALVDAGLYVYACPYFFCDRSFAYSEWWWMFVWSTGFGLSLMLINNLTFYVTRTTRGEDGKLHLQRKMKPDEDVLRDILHKPLAARAAKKKAALCDNPDKSGNNPT